MKVVMAVLQVSHHLVQAAPPPTLFIGAQRLLEQFLWYDLIWHVSQGSYAEGLVLDIV